MAMRADQADQLAKHPQRRTRIGHRLDRVYTPVPLEEVAPAAAAATLVAEDQRFREHGGIDFEAIRVALGYRRSGFSWRDPNDRRELTRALTQAWRRRDRVRGASTITQQLAKNLYLSPSRNPLRKLKEAVTAYRLEWAMSKDRLLELYLNVVEFGPEIWGIEAASQVYFKHSAQQLTPDQGAALAASLPFPLVSNPAYRPGRMRWRQGLILRRLRGELIAIPKDEADTGPGPQAPPDSVAPADSSGGR